MSALFLCESQCQVEQETEFRRKKSVCLLLLCLFSGRAYCVPTGTRPYVDLVVSVTKDLKLTGADQNQVHWSPSTKFDPKIVIL